MAGDAFQVLSDCPNCRVESAVVELLDPSIAEGVAVEARCQMCGYAASFGEVTAPGERFASAAVARAALARWAAAENEPDVARFCESTFCGLAEGEVIRRLLAGEPLPTGFDVLAYLFPGMAAGMAAEKRGTEAMFVPTRSMLGDAPAEPAKPKAKPAPPPRPKAEPGAEGRTLARALAAVMLADGEIKSSERKFLDNFLKQRGHPPLEDDDIRPWRPGDLPVPSDPRAAITAMVDLAYVDRQRDGSEWRVIREFARFWLFPIPELERMGQRKEEALAGVLTRLWWAVRGLLFTTPKP